MASFTEWLKQRSPEAYDTLSGFGNRPGPGGAAMQGLWNGASDAFRLSTQVANEAERELGLRTDAEAALATQQINNALQTNPFIAPQTQEVFRQGAEQYPVTETISNVAPSLVAGQALIKSGLKGIPLAARLQNAKQVGSSYGLSQYLDSLNNK